MQAERGLHGSCVLDTGWRAIHGDPNCGTGLHFLDSGWWWHCLLSLLLWQGSLRHRFCLFLPELGPGVKAELPLGARAGTISSGWYTALLGQPSSLDRIWPHCNPPGDSSHCVTLLEALGDAGPKSSLHHLPHCSTERPWSCHTGLPGVR